MQYLSYENYLSICIDFVMEFVRFVSVLFCSWKYEARKKLFTYIVGAFRVKKLCHLIQVFLFSVLIICLLLFLLFFLFFCCWPLKKENRIKRQMGTRIVAQCPSTAWKAPRSWPSKIVLRTGCACDSIGLPKIVSGPGRWPAPGSICCHRRQHRNIHPEAWSHCRVAAKAS